MPKDKIMAVAIDFGYLNISKSQVEIATIDMFEKYERIKKLKAFY
jgi:hypothetical protein